MTSQKNYPVIRKVWAEKRVSLGKEHASKCTEVSRAENGGWIIKFIPDRKKHHYASINYHPKII